LPGNFHIRVFRTLVVVQILVAISALWMTSSVHRVYRNSLARHQELRAYRQRVEAIAKKLQSIEGIAPQDGNTSKVLVQLAQDAQAVTAQWPLGPATDGSDTDLTQASLQTVAIEAQQLAQEASVPHPEDAGQRKLRQAQAHLLAAMRRLGEEADTLEAHEFEQLQLEARYGGWTEVLETTTLLLILLTVIYVAWLQRAIQSQVTTREETERELRRERNTLEQRVKERTAELQTEVQERRRAEQLNRGRNQVLEMLACDEPTQTILETLVETVATHRSTWACALHLLDGETLKLTAQSRLPSTLAARLDRIAAKITDAPEIAVLNGEEVFVLPDLNQEHRPWIELLRANGAQSAWSAPFLREGKPVGTMTIYTLLRYPPREADIELLKMSCQMASLILERQRMNEELIHRAYHDPLTGLGNRRLGKEGLEDGIRRSRRSGEGLGVFWMDLNKFKQINDTYGHTAGDQVLQEVARRLTSGIRSCDTVARMGGDEFMIVMERMENRKAAEQVANELLTLLSEPVVINDLQLSVTASVGISFYPEDGDSADTLEQRADVAMYKAKFGGVGVRSFTPVLNEERVERLALETEMARALEHGGFSLAYQPQCLATGEVIKLEALLRLEHSELGSIPPSRFIPIAEETQLILPLGRWVLEQACRQIRLWQDAGYPVVPVAVNISSLQFVREGFSKEVAEILAHAGVMPSLLELELTESIVMKDFAESARQMKKLKKLGVRIAIDDFGTGYSSLSYLHRLPIDVLKIDRSFVEMIDQSEGTLPIIEAIISMAQVLGLRVVGEGVETLSQMEALCKGGCDILQGYLFSQPVSAAKVVHVLEARTLTPTLQA